MTSTKRGRGATGWLSLAAVAAVIAVLLALAGIAATPVSADHPGAASGLGVVPTVVAGNPDCDDLGFENELKVEPVASGTYTDGSLTVTITVDGVFFDWVSDFLVPAVIVKGGPNANVYDYGDGWFADADLHAPINHRNDQPFGLSHISFCYDEPLEPPSSILDVVKTTNESFTRTFEWEIDKSVTPETWDLFTGDSGTSEYTVEVTKVGFTDSDWAVSGTVTITNTGAFPVEVDDITDELEGIGEITLTCPEAVPFTLDPDESVECTYGPVDLPNADQRTNSVTVESEGVVVGEGEAEVIFGDPTTVVNDTINVEDTFAGDLGSFSDTGSTSYERTFTCDDDEGTHNNTATIVETGQSDSASVTVNCYELEVTKDADTSLTRTWTWTIDKSADQTDLLLSEGQLFQVNYEVTVDATSTDSDWAVSGSISVHNPAPIAATVNSVSDVVSPAIAATVDCGAAVFPYTLAAGATLNCTYSADLPNGDDRTNTATATLQNYEYDSEGNATPSGTTDFTGSAAVSFANATVTEIDECINVSDTNVGNLGTVCANEAPKTFEYSLDFGAHPDADVRLECGENTHTNTASFVTVDDGNDTGATGSDNWTVNALVDCAEGCTLTPGYWKTHSHHGPAPEDDAWFLLGDVDGDGVSEGADEKFFLSGQSYYQVLWTPPAGGNAYYILAHAYIAAKLNILNGAASTPEVNAAIAWAEDFFRAKRPADRLSRSERSQAISTASLLDQYNNGIIGPGHCSEDENSG